MTIVTDTPELLVLNEPNHVNRFVGVIITVIGAMGTALIMSEPDATFPFDVIPILTHQLSSIQSVRLDRRRASGTVSRRVYAIKVNIRDTGRITLCGHLNRERYRRRAADRLRAFLDVE